MRRVAVRVAVRASWLVGSLLVASLLIFWATNALPGDIAQIRLGTNAAPGEVDALREQLGVSNVQVFSGEHPYFKDAPAVVDARNGVVFLRDPALVPPATLRRRRSGSSSMCVSIAVKRMIGWLSPVSSL